MCLLCLYLSSCWKLSAGMWNTSVSQQYLDFWLAKMWKNGCVFVMCVICSPRRLVGGDPDSCKGYPVYSRLVSTLVFHLYHERDGDAQEILIALLSKLSLLRRACYYMKGCGLTCPRARCITSSVYTLWNHNLIGVYSACLLVSKSTYWKHTESIEHSIPLYKHSGK